MNSDPGTGAPSGTHNCFVLVRSARSTTRRRGGQVFRSTEDPAFVILGLIFRPSRVRKGTE